MATIPTPWDLSSLALGQVLGQQQAYSQNIYATGCTDATYPYPSANYELERRLRAEEAEAKKRFTETELPAAKPEPSEFKQLSNHDFHELLSKFLRMIE